MLSMQSSIHGIGNVSVLVHWLTFLKPVTNLKEPSGLGTRIHRELHSLLLGSIMLFCSIYSISYWDVLFSVCLLYKGDVWLRHGHTYQRHDQQHWSYLGHREKYLPSRELIALNHTAHYLIDGLIFHTNLQAHQNVATSYSCCLSSPLSCWSTSNSGLSSWLTYWLGPTDHTGFTLPSSFLSTHFLSMFIWHNGICSQLHPLFILLYRAHGIWPEVDVQVLETRIPLCLLD